MKLKKLEISGFKSFPQKSSINFPTGISAVVGPNGCGKSNIADALRWVMGEQSVKQLRGKAMEDVIFAGTNGTAPTNLAEVSLTLVNDNGSAPVELKDYSEIMLTRRLYRSGESAYLLNRRPCRLKDIQNIFLGSGMGPKSYAIIQQGNVGAIIEAGPDGLRYFLEEAAGTTRYKSRKDEALRKVKQTSRNLLRLQDILAEIQRQMRGLQRQAKRAETYRRYQEKIRHLDIRLSLYNHDALAAAITDGGKILAELQDGDQADTARLRKIDAELEIFKTRRLEKGEAIGALRSRQHEGQRRADGMENDLKHTRETVAELQSEIQDLETANRELVAKNQGLAEEIAQVETETRTLAEQHDQTREAIAKEEAAARDLRQEAGNLKQELEQDKRRLMEMVAQEARINNICQSAANNRDSLRRRLKQTDENAYLAEQKVSELENQAQAADDELSAVGLELEDLNGHCGKLRQELGRQTQALGTQVKAVQTLELDYGKTHSQLAALKKMESNYEWYRDGVKAVMQNYTPARNTAAGSSSPDANPIKGLVADVLAPESGYETATEAALGEALQYVIVDQQATGAGAIAYLQQHQAGRSGFIPLNAVTPLDNGPQPGSARMLLDHIKVRPAFSSVAATLLGHVVLAANLKEAVALHNRNGVRQTIVTPRGDLISHQGVMLGGAAANHEGILAKKNQLRALERTGQAQKAKLDAERRNQAELEARVRTLETDLQQALEEREEVRLRATEVEKEAYRWAEELKHARSHLEIVQLEQEQLQGEELEFQEEIATYNKNLAEVQKKAADAEKSVAQTTTRMEGNTARMEQFNQRLIQIRLDQTAVGTRLETQRNTLKRLQTFFEDGQNRLGSLNGEIQRKLQRLAAARQNILALTENIKTSSGDLEELAAELAATEKEYQAIDGQLQTNDRQSAELRDRREKRLQKISHLEVEQTQRRMQQENIARQMQERYQLTPGQIRRDLARDPEYAATASAMAEMESQLNQTRERLARMPDVNLGAIQEYEEHKERFEFLTTQKEDLEKAIEGLHKVIRKINRISQERFLATFARVNEKLDIIFPKLFTGGKGQLVLTEPSKPLETGVEFMIHPPGKKVTRMSLLSGGEKALSAIAFIFAIFLIKPASFCLMDEIDAPLDDANIQRFNKLLKVIGEKSQIIMITHNKKSMEFADTLLGVTMEKKGISKIVSVNLEKSIQEAA